MSWGFLWLCYALSPALVVLYILGLESKRNFYLIILAFLWSFTSLTPHYLIYIPLLFISFFIFEVITILVKRKNYKKILVYFKKTLILFILYALLSSFWIIPYTLSSLFNKNPSPFRLITVGMVDFYSRNNYFFNLFRGLSGAWLGKPINYLPSYPLDKIWIILSFAIPILIFTILLFKNKNNKIILYLSLMVIFLIPLNAGTKGPFGNFYKWLIFQVPIIKEFNWVFRAPHRISGILIMYLSFLLAFMLTNFLSRLTKKGRILISFIYLIILTFLSYPTVFGYFKYIYKPQNFPNEYYEAKDIIDQGNKSVWFPPLRESGFNLKWMDDIQRINSFYDFSFPSYSARFDNKYTSSYLYYLYDKFIKEEFHNFEKHLGSINVSDFVFHNDLRYSPGNDLLSEQRDDKQQINKLKSTDDLEYIKSNQYLDFFKVRNYSPKFNILNNLFLIDQDLNTLNNIYTYDDFSPNKDAFVFLDQELSLNNDLIKSNQFNGFICKGREIDNLLINNADELIFPASYQPTNNQDYWVRGVSTYLTYRELMNRTDINDYNFDYGKNLIYALQTTTTYLPLSIKNSGTYDIYLRLLNSDRGGVVSLNFDNKKIETIETKNYSNKFRWHKISNIELNNKSILAITNNQGFNVINVIALYHKNNKPDSIESYLDNKKICYVLDENSFNKYRPPKPYLEDKYSNSDIKFNYRANELQTADIPGLVITDLESFGTWDKSDYVKVEQLVDYFAIDYKFNKLTKGTNLFQLSYKVPNKVFYNFDTLEMDLFGDNSNNEVLIIYKNKNSNWRILKSGIKINWFGWQTIQIKLPEEDNISAFQIGIKGNKNYPVNNFNSYLRLRDIEFKKLFGSKIETKINIPRDDNYKIMINFKEKITNNPLLVKIDNNTVDIFTNNNTGIADAIFLTKGEHTLTFLPKEKSVVRSIILCSDKNIVNSEKNKHANLTYQKINSTKYKINFKNIEEPFVLSFAESYDPLWAIKVDNKEIAPVPLYSVINGFLINKTGNFEAIIEYKPQRWFYLGLIVSGTTLIFCLGYLIFDWQRRKKKFSANNYSL